MRKATWGLTMAILASSVGLSWANPAKAADPPYVNGTLTDTGSDILATAYTNSWKKGTIKIDATLWHNGTKVLDNPRTCYSATSCSINPSPMHACSCPGTWTLGVDAWGPATNGSTYINFSKTLVATLVGGKLVFKEG
jgi:hypothetical protein